MAEWSYFQNPFLNAVKSNYKKALDISTFTDSRLAARQSGEFFAAQYAFYHPLHEALFAAYNDWRSQSGVQKGATLTLAQLLKLLRREKINAWDLAVMNVYSKGGSDYLTILPHKHKPFQRGAKEVRINAVMQLIMALMGKEALAATLADVEAFYTQLLNASTRQEGQKGNTGTHSNVLYATLTEAMDAMFKIFGACIQQFGGNVAVAAPIFDLAKLRQRKQSVYTGTLKAAQNHFVLEHTFAGDDELIVNSTGKTKLLYFLAASANAALNGQTSIAIDEEESRAILASAFGDLSLRFLHVINTSTDTEGHFKLQIK